MENMACKINHKSPFFPPLLFSFETFRIRCIVLYMLHLGFPGGLVGEESACSAGVAGDVGSILGSGRSPGGGHGNPVQYSCLENSMNRGTWWTAVHGVAESDTAKQVRISCVWS